MGAIGFQFLISVIWAKIGRRQPAWNSVEQVRVVIPSVRGDLPSAAF